jgi:hypothetical protein
MVLLYKRTLQKAHLFNFTLLEDEAEAEVYKLLV